MASNYAFQFGSQGMNTTPFLNAASRLPQGTTGLFNTDSSLGFEYFLQQMNPAITQDRTMRSLYESLWRRFGIDALSNPQQRGNNTWMNWLGEQDWNKELARLDPRMRNETGSQYNRPARWVAF